MEFTERGAGPPLLLIHGFPLNRRIWDAQIEGISGCRIIAPDLPGFGKSPLQPSPGSMEDYARALLGLMDSLSIGSFAAAGHSMGGYILFALLRIAPERLAGAALVSSRAIADTEQVRRSREQVARGVEKMGSGILADQMLSRLAANNASDSLRDKVRATIREAPPGGVVAALRAMAARSDAKPQLAGIACPAVVIAGRQDRIVPAEESEAMAGSIPGSTLVWGENSGHLPMMEEPDVVTRALAGLVT